MESPQKKKILNFVLILSALGWFIALYLVWHGVKLSTVGLEGPSICHINQFFDCDAVALSEYAKLFGIPVAAFLAAFYSAMLAFGVWATFALQDRAEETAKRVGSLMFLASVVFAVVSLYQAALSFFVIKAVCVFCLSAYVINLIIFYFCFKLYKGNKTPKISIDLLKLSSNLWIFVSLLIAFHLFLPRIVENSVSGVQSETQDLAIRQHFASTPKAFISDNYPIVGANAENAVLTIVEYSDFQCPHCKTANQALEPFFKAHSKNVRVVYKPYPLDGACNAGIQTSGGGGHPFACQAAKIAMCLFNSKGADAYVKYRQSVYTNQSSIGSASLTKWANELGLAEAEINGCLADSTLHQRIVESIDEGGRVGVSGTPTFFVNNKRLQIVTPKILGDLFKTYAAEKK